MRGYKAKVVEHFANPENSRCVVGLFKTYLSHIPNDGAFYRRPMKFASSTSTQPRFSIQTIGINTLKTLFKRMFDKAGISSEGRFISNHSGKVTLCTNLFNSQFSDQVVRSRSGHRSNAVEAYKRPLAVMTQSISDTLQPPQKRPFSSTITSADANKISSTSSTSTSTSTSSHVMGVGNVTQVASFTAPEPTTDDFEKRLISAYKVAKLCGSKNVSISNDGTINISVD